MDLRLEIEDFQSWAKPKGPRYLISGPCSVESPEQMQQVVESLKGSDELDALRGGIWKPRTRPDSFEGLGEKALPWLKQAGNALGIPVITEVANAQHVEAALDSEIDMLWIGARTSTNPFSVQEIADALKGVDVPVFVKNPINPDLQLWVGALERINKAGIKKLAAIHRGFSSFEDSVFRNIPMWEIPIALKSLSSELAIICDPSHIAGGRDMISFISQKAIDLDMEGLMIESHPDPAQAKSDAEQQLSPQKLEMLLKGLSMRKASSADPVFENQLEELRNIIDEIDAEIIKKLVSRMEIVERIGEYKRENEVTILQLERWKEILETRSALGKSLRLDERFIKDLLELIHDLSIKRQTEVMNADLQKK